MAPEIWFLRHGEAVPHDSKPDDDRELTARGERQALAAGEALARLGVEFSACYTSPKVRARDTARLACRELNVEPEDVAALHSGFDHDDALELLLAHDMTRGSSWSATSRTSRRSSTTLRARASTSRRAAWPPFAWSAAAASCSCCCARASSNRSPAPEPLAVKRRGDHRHRHLGPARQGGLEHELLRVVAAPPRGPRPSTVTGIADATWLGVAGAAAGRQRRPGGPSAAPARSSSGAVASPECMPGQRRISSARRRTPSCSAGMASTTCSIASSSSARRSQNSSPLPGTTLNASPLRSTVGHRGQPLRARRVVLAATTLRGAARASSALRPRSGPSPSALPPAERRRMIVPGCLAANDDRLLAVRRPLPALEAQARVPACEALDVGERTLRHSSSQTSSSATSA
jgi:hypothetical protein